MNEHELLNHLSKEYKEKSNFDKWFDNNYGSVDLTLRASLKEVASKAWGECLTNIFMVNSKGFRAWYDNFSNSGRQAISKEFKEGAECVWKARQVEIDLLNEKIELLKSKND